MAESQYKGPVAPAVVQRFVKQLNITFKAVKLYPLTSNIPRDNARASLDILHHIMQNFPEVRFEVLKEGLFYETLPVYPGHPAFMSFAREFYNRSLAEVRFHSGTTIDELLRFLSVLDVPAPELSSSGGFESRLWDLGVNNIAVKEVSTRVVEAGELQEEDEEWPPSARTIDEILAEVLGRRPRAQRLLTRLIADPEALKAYMTYAPSPEEGSPALTVVRRFMALARSASHEDPESRERLNRSLASSLRSLDLDVLREVLGKLVGEARHDEVVASALRSMGLEELCAGLIAGASFADGSRDEVARTVRNLISLGFATRQETMSEMAKALMAAGATEEFTAGVLADAMPSQLRVRERRPSEERPADIVLRLLDLASTNIAAVSRRPAGVDELAEEAARGISDGDVFAALVTLVTIEDRPEEFASVMSMLENNIGLLIERYDFDVAADAAEALVHAERREGLDEVQKQRLHAALAQLASPQAMRVVTGAMRTHRPGSPEHDACKRLLSILGENTVSALLEVLAEEKDMASRKALVDTISSMAERFIPELGNCVSDSRWYFVRNVVTILGTTKDPRVLQYLERTLRYTDARVRRETIRALSGVRDALAGEMLVAALADDDGGNAQLAARQLGAMRLRRAVPALVEVARGEGRGNRDMETRIEAIEALGRIGAAEAAPVLESIAKQRSIRASRSRELRAAAEGALASIRAGGGAA